MSITDAGSNLSTSWTEQTTVAFTSGTLADIDDCVNEVESKLRRGVLSGSSAPTDAEVKRWLIRAKQELAETKNYTWRRRYAYCSTAADTYRYALPPDYDGGPLTLKDISNNRDIPIWPDHVFNAKYPDPSEEASDEPLVASIMNRELWLVPPPDGAYTLEIWYSRSGDDNTTTDFSWLPEIERFRCCDYAVYQSFKSLHMWQESEIYKQDWMQGLAKAVRADSKRKWARQNYQMVSWLQMSVARRNQSIED